VKSRLSIALQSIRARRGRCRGSRSAGGSVDVCREYAGESALNDMTLRSFFATH
jgi:hypothetical protein